MRLLGLTKRVKINGKVFVIRNYHLKPLQIIWPTLFFLDYVIHSAIRVRLVKWLGENVVCDRYVYDMLAQLLADDACPCIISRLTRRVFAWPSISLLLDVKESTSWDRTLQGERTLEQPLYDITVRRSIYLKLAHLYGMIMIDGERPFEQVNDEVTRSVFAELPRIRSESGLKS